jgi:hypothetical protein
MSGKFKCVPGRRALTPRQIKEQYAIPPSSLHFYCTGLPAKERLPSFMLPGRTGKKDTRKVYEDELQQWLEKHRASKSAA